MQIFTKRHFNDIFCFMKKTSVQPSLGEWLSAEPYTLALSSGFFGFYAQSGVISALHEKELLPEATRGSSAGALATAVWASGRFDYGEIGNKLSEIKRADFWDPGIGAGLLKGGRLDNILKRFLVDRFEDCSVPVHVSVFDIRSRQTEVVDSGDLTQAVRASMTYPGLLQPVIINGRPKLDGGIKDHAGCHSAPLDERILHLNLRPERYNVADRGYHNSQTLLLDGLPSVHPFNLHKGMVAFQLARAQTLVKLDQPIA